MPITKHPIVQSRERGRFSGQGPRVAGNSHLKPKGSLSRHPNAEFQCDCRLFVYCLGEGDKAVGREMMHMHEAVHTPEEAKRTPHAHDGLGIHSHEKGRANLLPRSGDSKSREVADSSARASPKRPQLFHRSMKRKPKITEGISDRGEEQNNIQRCSNIQ